MDIKPITRIILQADDRYYSLDWDDSAGIVIVPGWGVGTVKHRGQVHSIASANSAQVIHLSNPTSVQSGWTALTLTPDDDVSAALDMRGANAALTLAAGDYRGQQVRLPDDQGLTINEGAATGIEFYR